MTIQKTKMLFKSTGRYSEYGEARTNRGIYRIIPRHSGNCEVIIRNLTAFLITQEHPWILNSLRSSLKRAYV